MTGRQKEEGDARPISPAAMTQDNTTQNKKKDQDNATENKKKERKSQPNSTIAVIAKSKGGEVNKVQSNSIFEI